MTRYGMVIDLRKCVGCGSCAIACKSENNTSDRSNGQTHNWADFLTATEGSFPDVRQTVIPVLCNHCSKAPCVKVCPTEPKAMYKTEGGLTMHNDDLCIGCQSCQFACPYSALDVDEDGVQYSVISFNAEESEIQSAYKDEGAFIAGCTASGAATSASTGGLPPYRHGFEHPDYRSVRRAEITEKCTFCAHRVGHGEDPWCVVCCPAEARIFGDLEDPESAPSRALGEHESFRLKEEAGTQPAVYYIREYNTKKR